MFTITLKDATGTNDTIKLVSTATTAAPAVVETFALANIENASVTLVSAAAGNTHDITFDAGTSTLKTVTVTGTGGLTVSATNAVKATLVTLDASSLKGGLTYTADGGFTKIATINGGTGNDVINLTAQTGVKITGGAGADTIGLGAGSATAVYKAGTDSTLTSGTDQVTGFTTTVDKIDLTALALTNKTIGTSALGTPAGDVDGLFKIAGVQYGLVHINGVNDYAIDVNGDGNFSAATDLYIKGIGTAVLADFLL